MKADAAAATRETFSTCRLWLGVSYAGERRNIRSKAIDRRQWRYRGDSCPFYAVYSLKFVELDRSLPNNILMHFSADGCDDCPLIFSYSRHPLQLDGMYRLELQ